MNTHCMLSVIRNSTKSKWYVLSKPSGLRVEGIELQKMGGTFWDGMCFIPTMGPGTGKFICAKALLRSMDFLNPLKEGIFAFVKYLHCFVPNWLPLFSLLSPFSYLFLFSSISFHYITITFFLLALSLRTLFLPSQVWILDPYYTVFLLICIFNAMQLCHCFRYSSQTITYCVLLFPCRLGGDVHSTSINKMNFIKAN